jgi:DNA ligase (NAD+)
MSPKELKKLEEQYLRYKYEYYILCEPTISDPEFDEFENKLRNLGSTVVDIVDFPSTADLKKMGYDISKIIDSQEKDETKYNHWTPYLSLEKIQVNDEKNMPLNTVGLFLNRMYGVEYFESTLKYDGNAIENLYIDGKLHQSLTRGNKLYGFDKTNKMKYLVPNEIPIKGKVQIRGEIVMKKDIFLNKYFVETKTDTGQNARNTVAGLMNKDDFNINELQDMIYVAYDLIKFDDNGKSFNIENTMDKLYDLGFNQKYKPEVLYLKNINDFEDLYFKMKKLKEDSFFLIDGFVLKFNEKYRQKLGINNSYPKWACAIKFKSEEVATEIIGIEWTLGKNNELYPVACLKKVLLLGTLVQKASLSNLGMIIKNKYFIGSKVLIKKSGEIIPMIIKQLEPSPYEKEYMKEYEDFLRDN